MAEPPAFASLHRRLLEKLEMVSLHAFVTTTLLKAMEVEPRIRDELSHLHIAVL